MIAIVGISLSVSSVSAAVHDVSNSSDNVAIQDLINNLNDGDTLNFLDGVYEGIGLIINKSISITSESNAIIKAIDNHIGNLDSDDISKYKIDRASAFYFVDGSLGSEIYNMIITSMGDFDYLNESSPLKNSLIYAIANTSDVKIYNNTLSNSAWGIYVARDNGAENMHIYNNTITNMSDTGIINFGSKFTIIEGNIISNILRHGIDVRHAGSANTTVSNNIITNVAEGIYTMHSGGHTFTNNQIEHAILSAITVFAGYDNTIENNKLIDSAIGILLTGEYQNIVLKNNSFSYNLSHISTSPNFGYDLVTGSLGNPNTNVEGTFNYETKVPADISISSGYEKGSITNGENVRYIVKISNTGKASGENISLSNILPAGVSTDSIIVSRGSFSNGIWNVGTLSADSEAILTFYVKPSKAGTFSNTITAKYNDNLNTGNSWVDISASQTKLSVQKDNKKLSYAVSNTKNVVKKGKKVKISVKVTNKGLDTSDKLSIKIGSKKLSATVANKSSKTVSSVVKAKKGTQKIPVYVNGKKIKTVKIKGK